MSEKQETHADIIAEMRGIRIREFQDYADRFEVAHRRECVLAVSIMRAELYGIAGGLRALTARSDARQRGIHYSEVQNIAAQIENIADNGGEA